jgi:hypothetical protein
MGRWETIALWGIEMRLLNGSGAPLRSLAFCLLTLTAIAGAHAGWSQQDRATTLSDCNTSCLKNPNVAPRYHGQCPAVCECSSQRTEAEFPDFNALSTAVTNSHAATMERLKTIANACGQSIFR